MPVSQKFKVLPSLVFCLGRGKVDGESLTVIEYKSTISPRGKRDGRDDD
jgi:hypothetical protein